VLANWAFFWGTVADMNIATVATLPNRYAVSLEDHAIFNVLKQFTIAFFVLGFNFADFFE
jgi:hypothetical protein